MLAGEPDTQLSSADRHCEAERAEAAVAGRDERAPDAARCRAGIWLATRFDRPVGRCDGHSRRKRGFDRAFW